MTNHMNKLSTGWFGIPGGYESQSTKVHIVRGGKPICGANLRDDQAYQFCAGGARLEYVECRRCKASNVVTEIVRKELEYWKRYESHGGAK